MNTALHFGGRDTLLFQAWHPSSPPAVAGASIGIFVFGVVERLVAAWRRRLEHQWKSKALALVTKHQPSNPVLPCTQAGSTEPKRVGTDECVEVGSNPPGSIRSVSRVIPPFIISHDIPRGMIHALQSTFTYAQMLVVMTFNGAYIISLIVGLGVGECLFGRVERA